VDPGYDTIAVGGRANAVAPLSLSDGCPHCRSDVAKTVTRPTIGRDRIYVGASNGHLLAFERTEGREVWRFEEPDGTYPSTRSLEPLVLANDHVYAPNFDGTFYVVSSETGELQWRFRAEDRLVLPPIVESNRVLFASQSGSVYALATER
jgi:outer membrane protein assembly factor BamB